MDGQNNQTNPVNPAVNQVPPPVIGVPSEQGSPVVPLPGGGSNKNLIILIIAAVVILLVLGGTLFFYMSQPLSKSPETSSVPVAEVTSEPKVAQTESAVTDVKGTSDLDQLITELAQVDSSLEKELGSLEKDSNF